MDQAGIDMAGLCRTIENLEEARYFNNEFSKVVQDFPPKFVAFVRTHPKEVCLKIEKRYQMKFLEIGEEKKQLKKIIGGSHGKTIKGAN